MNISKDNDGLDGGSSVAIKAKLQKELKSLGPVNILPHNRKIEVLNKDGSGGPSPLIL